MVKSSRPQNSRPSSWTRSDTWTDALLQGDGFSALACNKNVHSRAGGVAIYVKNEFVGGLEVYPLPATGGAVVSVCADGCAVRLNNGTVIATVYISPSAVKKEIERYMVDVFGEIKPTDNTFIVIVGDFNVDVSRPEGAWIVTLLPSCWSALGSSVSPMPLYPPFVTCRALT